MFYGGVASLDEHLAQAQVPHLMPFSTQDALNVIFWISLYTNILVLVFITGIGTIVLDGPTLLAPTLNTLICHTEVFVLQVLNQSDTLNPRCP